MRLARQFALIYFLMLWGSGLYEMRGKAAFLFARKLVCTKRARKRALFSARKLHCNFAAACRKRKAAKPLSCIDFKKMRLYTSRNY